MILMEDFEESNYYFVCTNNIEVTIFKMLKKNLEAIKSGDSNLYEHLVKLLKEMIINNDKDSYHLF